MLTMSARSAAVRAVSPAPDEVMDLLAPLASHNSIALTSTQTDMPVQIQTTDRPVVLMVAPLTKQECENCERMEKMNVK